MPVRKIYVNKLFHKIITALLSLVLWASTAHADPVRGDDIRVRVRIFSTRNVKKLEIAGDGLTCKFNDNPVNTDRIIARAGHTARRLGLVINNKNVVSTAPVTITSNAPFRVQTGSKPARTYKGKIMIRNVGGRLIVILTTGLEDYVCGVVKGETPSAGMAALKAQAVAARSFALVNLKRHKKEGYDFCDSTHCQFFAGYTRHGSPHHIAVMETRGIVLARGGRIVPGFYHSTCGGHTSPASLIFGGPGGLTKGIRDIDEKGKAYCRKSVHYKWKTAVTADSLNRIMEEEDAFADVGRLISITTAEKTGYGRIITARITGNRGGKKISGYRLWQILGSHLGWGRIESAWFTVERRKEKGIGYFIFHGRGLGHGVGMCQHGAMEMAKRGFNFEQILSHYFPGADLRHWRDLRPEGFREDS